MNNSPLSSAVICGGTSSEKEISLRSGTTIRNGLIEAGWNVVLFDIRESDVPSLIDELRKFDVVFIGFHGGAGEDGRVQSILDIAGIPYTGSDHISSALAMDKIFSKRIFENARIPTPGWLPWVSEEEPPIENIVAQFGFPVVIKPAREGSTVGITIAKNEKELIAGIATARGFGKRILFEEYIPGREVTSSFLEGERLPVIEIIPKDGFYDYEHKYTSGASVYECPANLPESVADEIIDIGYRTCALLGIRHYGRVDFRLNGDKPYVLEVNSLPGMTPLSLVPLSAKTAGIGFPMLVDRIARMAIKV